MKNLFIVALLFFCTIASAQIVTPVKWSYAAKRISKTEAVVLFKATVDNGWHLYSQYIPEGGPVATKFEFSPSKAFTKVGKTIEPKPIVKFEKVFNMNVGYFEKSVVFQQKIKLASNAAVVKGTLEYMACNDHQCLPPDEVSFSIAVK